MAFPSTQGPRDNLVEGVRRAINLAATIKAKAEATSAESLAGPILRRRIHQYSHELRGQITVLEAIAALPNIGTAFQSLLNDPTLQIGTEWTAMKAAMGAVVSWITANTPTATAGGITGPVEHEFDADGLLVEASYTTAQLAGLRTVLDALALTIA